jgi:type III secretion protein S
MSEAQILFTANEAMLLVLLLSLPPIAVASILGVGMSLIQAVTQIQEQTLSFAVKLLGVTLTLVATAAWLGRELLVYAARLFEQIGRLG